MATTKYVKMTSNGYLRIRVPGTGHTKCGRNYIQYDYLPVSEDEFDPNCHAICHKCANKRLEGPRTIREAFVPRNFLG